MDDVKTTAMIALLPTTSDWCKIELPHMTLVYAGKIEDLPATDFNEMAKHASVIATLSSPIFLKVKGVETFGDDDEKVDVFTLETTGELFAMRSLVDRWNASEYNFNPHVTIGPSGSYSVLSDDQPLYISFDRIAVAWGEELISFRFKPAS